MTRREDLSTVKREILVEEIHLYTNAYRTKRPVGREDGFKVHKTTGPGFEPGTIPIRAGRSTTELPCQ